MTTTLDQPREPVRRRPWRAGAVGTTPALEKLVAAALCVAVGTRQDLFKGLTVGCLLALVALPLWLGVVPRYRSARTFLVLGAATAVGGLGLSWVSEADHVVVQRTQIADTLVLVSILAGVGALLWARERLAPSTVGVLYGIGALGQRFLSGGIGAVDNQWKQIWAVPLAIIVLSLTMKSRRGGVDCLALGLLAAVSAVSDSRSYAATFLLALLLRLWQMRPANASGKTSVPLTAAFFVGLAATIYFLVQSLLVGGYLGAAAQAKTEAQIQTSGSLLLGGRPEASATIALIEHGTWGYGVGVKPSSADIEIAKNGFATVNYDPNNGYVEKYMFGSGFELHSMIGDMWARWGLLGLALLGFVVVVLLRETLVGVVERRYAGLLLFAVTWTMWNTFFSPLLTSISTMVIALGLGLNLRRRPADQRPVASARR